MIYVIIQMILTIIIGEEETISLEWGARKRLGGAGRRKEKGIVIKLI